MPGPLKCLLDALQRCFDLQDVLAGLNDEQVDITSNQPFRLLLEGVPHRVEIDVPQGGQFRGWAHGPCDEARFFWRAVAICHLTRQFRGFLVQREGTIFKPVFH